MNLLRLFSGLLCLGYFPLQTHAATDYFCFQADQSKHILLISAQNYPTSFTLQYYPYLKPIQLKHYKTESIEMAAGRPFEFHNFYYEIINGKNQGRYEIVHQGSQIYTVIYTLKTTAKQTYFDRRYPDQITAPLQYGQQKINCI